MVFENEKKRVCCLYRVSTLGQVEKDDIPMQKQRCREFCEQKKEWEIVKEFSEKGVSGFKVSAKDRDAIQELQRMALKNEFDILLVFMFDRLGRKDDETPFVVEWFVQNGIEVWSAVEGQQRFDNHVDKLLNYIRYWQASGESIKTSIRTKTRKEQLTKEGKFTGGTVPFGYRLEYRGRLNKRNKEVGDLTVDQNEAEIVQLIFQKYVYEGYGLQRLGHFLTEVGIRNRQGTEFVPSTLNRIIRNVLYTGVIHSGESRSEVIPELKIIEKELFERAQEIMEKRVTRHNDVPLSTKSHALLVNKVYCGHCGGKLTLTTSGRRRVKADGTVVHDVRGRYHCFYKSRHPNQCDGQSGYGVDKLDRLVDQIIRIQLERLQAVPAQKLIEKETAKETEQVKAKINLLTEQYHKREQEYQDLRAETIKVIQGTSRLNADLLNSLVDETTAQIKNLKGQLEAAQEELSSLTENALKIKTEYAQLVSWATLYDTCTFEAKKMIIAQLVDRIEVKRDYEIDVKFNVSFEGLQDLYLEAETPLEKKQRKPVQLGMSKPKRKANRDICR